MASVTIVVPWRGGCPARERAWGWVQARYQAERPEWQLVEAPGPDPWVKAAAAMPAVEQSPADGIVVVADADVWCDGLSAAIDAVASGNADWAIPHRKVHRLSAQATAGVLAGGSIDPIPDDLARHAYEGVDGGGLVVAHRGTMLEIPLDPRFVRWGQEDESWAFALHCLAGPAWRGTAPLLHLWHPLQPRQRPKVGSRESWALRGRYLLALNDPAAMRELLKEATDVTHSPDGQAVHDHQPDRVG